MGECRCGGVTSSPVTHEVKNLKDQALWSHPIPELGSVIQLRTCQACRRVDRRLIYVNPELIEAEKVDPSTPTTNSLLDFF